jgi:cell division protein FtsN
MPEETELDIKALHEEIVEERARGDSLAQRVALLTAILSTIGAVFSFQSGSTSVEAEVLKSDSVAKLTQASDQWAYYQAKSTREFTPEPLPRKPLTRNERRSSMPRPTATRQRRKTSVKRPKYCRKKRCT